MVNQYYMLKRGIIKFIIKFIFITLLLGTQIEIALKAGGWSPERIQSFITTTSNCLLSKVDPL